MYDLSDTASVRSFGSYGSSSSLAMAQSGAPELLVSLCYQSLTGRLTVEVLKASNLRNLSMQRAPGEIFGDDLGEGREGVFISSWLEPMASTFIELLHVYGVCMYGNLHRACVKSTQKTYRACVN